MATSAWLHGPSAMRLTECLVSVLKEQRPEYLPSLLANYREHGVFPTQVGPGTWRTVSSEASHVLACCRCSVLQAGALCRPLSCVWRHLGWVGGGSGVIVTVIVIVHYQLTPVFISLQSASAVGGLVGFSNAKLGSSKTK